MSRNPARLDPRAVSSSCPGISKVRDVALSTRDRGSFSRTARAVPVVEIASVSVSSSLGTGVLDVLVPPSNNGQYQYLSGPSPIDIFSSDANHNLLATIQPFGLSVNLSNDPIAGLSFGVVAGNAPTNFTISTIPVTFAAIPSPVGFASTGTDGHRFRCRQRRA